MKEIAKVNVLGTEYTIISANEQEDPRLEKASGLCDFSTKEICIREWEVEKDSLQNKDHFDERVLRHELVHAFFYESGLDFESDYARNEELVDWIAIQSPKMVSIFDEIEIL